jgi:hypothetical protein
MRDGGRRRIYSLNLGSVFGLSLVKGNMFSSKITSHDMYMRPVERSRHLKPLWMLLHILLIKILTFLSCMAEDVANMNNQRFSRMSNLA